MLAKTLSRPVGAVKTSRVRDKRHLAYVASWPCCVPACGLEGVQVHHLTCGPEPKARGLKAGDDQTVPLCRGHHDSLHARGDERAFWAEVGFDAIAYAAQLWAESRAGRAMP
jgi:hypothetical protein